MKINWNYIKIPIVIGLVIFLYGFSGQRNSQRKLGEITVAYTNPENIYITDSTVSNLLAIKGKDLTDHSKDSLNLTRLEKKMDQNPMIANAEIFKSITGDLSALITQREPLGRVIGENPFYIDKQGGSMPLSPNYSARVPLVNQVDSTDIQKVFPLLKKINKDDFLTKHIIGIRKSARGDFILKMRGSALTINFGEIKRIDQKIRNFKAFYKKAHIDHKLDDYRQVNLKFVNQVVCTKKEV